jgi:hypothetical protein
MFCSERMVTTQVESKARCKRRWKAQMQEVVFWFDRYAKVQWRAARDKTKTLSTGKTWQVAVVEYIHVPSEHQSGSRLLQFT